MRTDSDTEMVFENGSGENGGNHSNQLLIQTSENFSEGDAFGTPESEFLDSPLLHPTPAPSPDWFLTLSDSSERQQEIDDRYHTEPQTNLLNSNYSNGYVEFGSSSGSAGSTLDSVQGSEFYAQQTGSPPFIPQPGDSPMLDIFLQEENSIPGNGTSPFHMPYSEYEIDLAQQNHSLGQYNGGDINEQLLPLQMETLNLGHNAMFPNQFETANSTVNGFNGNSHEMLYPNGFPQNTTSGMGFQNGTPNTWLPNYSSDLYRASATSGPMDSNNQQQLNQVQPTSNGTNINHPYSTPPDQQNQVPVAQGGHQGNMLPETNMPLRPLVSPQFDQFNQGLNGANFMMPNPFNLANSNIMMQEPQMLQRPPQFMNQQQMMPNLPNSLNYNNGFQGTNPFPGAANHLQPNPVLNGSMMNGFPFQNPARMQMQQQAMMNQATRPTASYPGPGASFPGYILDTSALQQPNRFNAGPSIPPQMGHPNGNGVLHNNGTGAQRGQTRSRTGLGESSSPFRRFRRECYASPRFPNLAVPPPPEPPAVPNPPRPVRNSLYDPAYQSLGLAVDPHLRMFNMESH